MARIGKRDHARIMHLVDVEQRKVSEVASEYGCSAANIYNLLSKLRRTVAAPGQSGPAAPPEPPPSPMPAAAPAADLFAAAEPPPAPPAPPAAARAPTPDRAPATVTELPRKGPAGRREGIGAALAKPGFGLTMRTPDGDENVTPFRSLEDLLSAVKPMLRASARSQDPVWFSIQPIDLSAVEFDAA